MIATCEEWRNRAALGLRIGLWSGLGMMLWGKPGRKLGPVPIIVITSHHDEEFIQRAQQQHVLAFLVKPITAANLAPTVAIAMQRFAECGRFAHVDQLSISQTKASCSSGENE